VRWGHEAGRWDLSALLNAAEGLSGRAQRHLWLARLLEWLRHEPREAPADGATPPALLRLRHLLNVLENNPEYGQRVQKLFVDFWGDIRAVGLFSDFGFSPRTALYSEVLERLRLHVLPATPDTRELAELFALLFRPADASWVAQIDAATLQRLGSAACRSGRRLCQRCTRLRKASGEAGLPTCPTGRRPSSAASRTALSRTRSPAALISATAPR